MNLCGGIFGLFILLRSDNLLSKQAFLFLFFLVVVKS